MLSNFTLPYGVPRDQSQQVLCLHKPPRRGVPGVQEVALQRIGCYTSKWNVSEYVKLTGPNLFGPKLSVSALRIKQFGWLISR
jgi:hypothetical protein